MSGLSEMQRVAARVEPYKAAVSRADEIAVAFSDAAAVITGSFEWPNEEIPAAIRAALSAPALVEAYVAVVPCVEVFVATELDTVTPGERGLGRSSTFPPRLGGAFRSQLSDRPAREAFGPLIEAAVRDAYVGTAAITAGIVHPLTTDPHEVFGRWVPRAYVGTKNVSDFGMDVIACCSSSTEIRLFETAEAHGLLGGFRKKRKEETFTVTAGFWVAAGAALFRTASDQPD